jgi:hypothetical protein
MCKFKMATEKTDGGFIALTNLSHTLHLMLFEEGKAGVDHLLLDRMEEIRGRRYNKLNDDDQLIWNKRAYLCSLLIREKKWKYDKAAREALDINIKDLNEIILVKE